METETQRVILSNEELTARLLDVRAMELALVLAFCESRYGAYPHQVYKVPWPDWLLQAWGAFQQGMSPDRSLGPVPDGTWEYLQAQLDERERRTREYFAEREA